MSNCASGANIRHLCRSVCRRVCINASMDVCVWVCVCARMSACVTGGISFWSLSLRRRTKAVDISECWLVSGCSRILCAAGPHCVCVCVCVCVVSYMDWPLCPWPSADVVWTMSWVNKRKWCINSLLRLHEWSSCAVCVSVCVCVCARVCARSCLIWRNCTLGSCTVLSSLQVQFAVLSTVVNSQRSNITHDCFSDWGLVFFCFVFFKDHSCRCDAQLWDISPLSVSAV